MPLTKIRRPKFERQDIKQNLFTCYLSCQRLNKIQQFLKSKQIEGLLIIIGIDGRFNAGSLEMFNYLFFDIFNTRKDDMERSKLDDDIFDDVMVCVKIDEVHVYCNGANYWLMLPYMAHWQGLRLHCISEIEMEDPEKLEKFKMDTFAEMTRSCDKIAVATKGCYESSDNEPFDVMQVESWPIVQSYAYDDFGQYSQDNSKKGFFTLVHKVMDMSNEIHQLCVEIDPVHLENIYQKVLPQMEGLLENIFQLLDSKCYTENFEINEEIIEEPVHSYYNHLKNSKLINTDSVKMMPLVLCGKNTVKSILLEKLTNNSTLTNRDKVIQNPKHMVIQCVSLNTGIVIARTVFLQGCTHLYNNNKDSENTSNVMKLSFAYNAIVSTADFVIDHLKSSKNVSLNEKDAEIQLKYLLNKSRYTSCSFKIKKVGNPNDSHGFLVVLQGIVYDIYNEDRGDNLGSVIFTDTFLVTTCPLNKEENLNAILRLGKRIPLFNYWSNSNLSKVHNIMNEVNKIEPCCTEVVDIILTNKHFRETYIQQLCCTFYPDRILLFNKRVGASILYPESVEIFEGETYGDWSIFSINCISDRSKMSNWIWNQSNERYALNIVFPNHGKVRKSITNLLIPQWKATIKITYNDNIKCPFLESSWKFIQYWMANHQVSLVDSSSQSIIDGISDDAHQSQLIRVYNAINFSLINRKSYIRVFAQFMVLSYSLRFYDNVKNLDELVDSQKEVFESLVQNLQPHPIINHSKLSKLKPTVTDLKSSIVVTVLCGLPGSGQELLSRKITKIIHDDFNWILLAPLSINEVTSLTESMLKSFDSLLEDENNNLRILLLAPPLCFPSEIVKSLKNVISKVPIVIGSICVCLNPEAAFLDNKECTLPGILDMCNEGWVNTIILTGNDISSIKSISLFRMLITRNNLCTIFRTPKADVSKELDNILSKVSFQQERFDLARVLYPLPSQQPHIGLENVKKISTGFYEIFYNVYGPLIKENIIRTLRDIFKTLKPAPYEKNIYFIDGLIELEEDPQHKFSLSVVSLMKQVIIYPMDKRENRGDNSKSGNAIPPFLRIFVTTEMDIKTIDESNKFKDHFLTILQNFQRQIPQKKKTLTASDLSLTQIDEIHKARHLEPLAEGWFYNGITYVHMDGSRSDKHPGLPEFINSFIDNENLEVEKANAKIDKITVKNAFLKP